MRLARNMGYLSRRKMLASMTALDLAEWEVFYASEPFGDARQDQRFVNLANVIVQALIGGDNFIKKDDFLPSIKLETITGIKFAEKQKEKKKKSWKQLLSIAKSIHGKLSKKKR
jgi:hypothetical protein